LTVVSPPATATSPIPAATISPCTGERGELGVDQLVLVVAEIDRAQRQQRHRHDVEEQDAAGQR
jgi:hypothetical protein